MKKIILACLFICFFCSCEKNENSFESPQATSLVAQVIYNGLPEEGAVVMCILSDTEEVVFKCNKSGTVNISVKKPIKMIVAMAPGLNSIIENPEPNQKSLQIYLETVSASNVVREKSVAYVGTFGVYDTDGNGDVRFRYQGTFIDYDCINNLPWLGSSPDPNDWDGWDLDDFLPWEGKKLLVPRRYQTYHSTVYGYSISDALILRADI